MTAWIFSSPGPKPKKQCSRGKPIECGQTVRFEHTTTSRNLHSHHFGSPLSNAQEVSAFGDEGKFTHLLLRKNLCKSHLNQILVFILYSMTRWWCHVDGLNYICLRRRKCWRLKSHNGLLGEDLDKNGCSKNFSEYGS